MAANQYLIGMDVGSTTVKAVVVDSATDAMIWHDYQRHETRQPEKVLEFLKRIDDEVDGLRAATASGAARVFITGSGGMGIAPRLGAKFVQEVNAVCLAVEKVHPAAGSVIELGGQDAKIIVFKEDPETGRKKKIPSMNDKCAGGTGAVIDKINAKLRIPAEELCQQGYNDIKLHHVAGKCGVFAETDINGLQKQGIPTEELMASLFEAIIGQNLAVLTRGHTLRPEVILLGGPNTYIKGMREAWQHNIPITWKEREVKLPEGVDPKSLIVVPQNAQYYAALGAVEYGKDEDEDVGVYKGWTALEDYINNGRKQSRQKASAGLSKDPADLESFKQRYHPEPYEPATFESGEVVRAFIGLDGGSTSTKAVLVNEAREVICKAYQLSKGNPIKDTIEVIGDIERHVASCGARLEILGVGTTGYAKDVLRDVLAADAAIVETVAHAESALHFYDDVDVICDVGGQDIKIMVLKDGSVKDFKLNTQCSAGNGYFLQSTAGEFGVPVENFADTAFGAEQMPTFGYGCAVFMQSDIVDFQRQGWTAGEIMAGLAAVLPKNIWLYVAQIPNLAKLGKRFVLQGGTQRNLAAVKSQVDFISSRFRGTADDLPEVIVHKHCGESGAIGAALEAARLYENVGRHALPLLQERLPAHLHRRGSVEGDQARPGRSRHRQRHRRRAQVQGAARAGRAAADRQQLLRKGPGGRRRVDARDQEGPRRAPQGRAELRREERARRVQELQAGECGRSAARARVHLCSKEARRAHEEARELPHRHSAHAEPVLHQSAVLGVLRGAWAARTQPGVLGLHHRRGV
jgi:activator of 2-hydroxyglutaryl-CoA dehydratase